MSIIDDMLILVEDQNEISLQNAFKKMSKFKKQTISSSLGRLSAKGLIDKYSRNQEKFYKINRSGTKLIDKELEYINYIDPKNIPNEWNMVIFNIPEKLRKHRDELRRQLVNHGFGRLHDSLWFSKCNLNNQIKEIALTMQIEKNLLFIKTTILDQKEEKQIIAKLYWDWQKIEKSYNQFCSVCKNFLQKTNKDKFQAKQLVYQLSKIIKADPKINEIYYPEGIKKEQAISYYKKIRPYCYN